MIMAQCRCTAQWLSRMQKPEIIDALFILISMMGHAACCLLFYLYKSPILLLWMDATLQPYDCWMGKTINCKCSDATHIWAHLGAILTVIGCSTAVQNMDIVFIGSQYTVSMYYHLNPRSSRHLRFWPTTKPGINMMNDVGPSCFGPLHRQFTT